MGRKTVELRAIIPWCGKEFVQTGIYVFSDTTLEKIMELMENGIEIQGKRLPVSKVEFDVKCEKED